MKVNYLAKRLKHKIDIKKGSHTPNENGGLDITYTTIATMWAAKRQIGNYIMQLRAGNIEEYGNRVNIDTDEFIVRYSSIKNMGKAFSAGFSAGLDSLEDLYPIKQDFYVFLRYKDSNSGRLYRINRVCRDDNNKEMMILRCSEDEEQGLGASE